MKNITNDIATYAERIEPAKRMAKARHIQDTVTHIEKSRDDLIAGGRAFVSGVEELRLAGLSWLAGSDKNQYDLYFYNYAETLVEPEKRRLLTREIVKTAIHFATVIPEPIKELQIAMPFVQKAVMAFSMSKPVRRGIENAHVPPSLFAEFESLGKTACVKVRKLIGEYPLEDMNETELDVIIKEWLPVYEAVDTAKRLRLGLLKEKGGE